MLLSKHRRHTHSLCALLLCRVWLLRSSTSRQLILACLQANTAVQADNLQHEAVLERLSVANASTLPSVTRKHDLCKSHKLLESMNTSPCTVTQSHALSPFLPAHANVFPPSLCPFKVCVMEIVSDYKTRKKGDPRPTLVCLTQTQLQSALTFSSMLHTRVHMCCLSSHTFLALG